MSVVVDAGVAIKWMIAEPYIAEAKALRNYCLRRRIPVIAPALLRYEIGSVLRRKVRDGLITAADGTTALRDILRIVILAPFDQTLTERAMAIAAILNQKYAYDCQYLALAERDSIDFWTADEPFYKDAQAHFPQVKWIPTYQVPSR